MIKRLSVSNYRSLGENVSVELGPFTALVGPNGSGKSNVVDVLRFVSDAMHLGLSGAISSRGGIGAIRRWSGGHPHSIAIGLELTLETGHPASYSFTVRGDRAEDFKIQSEEAAVWNGEEEFRFWIESGRWTGGPPGLVPPLDGKGLVLPIIGGDARFQPLVSTLQQIAVYTIFPDTLRTPQKYSTVKPMDRHGSNWSSVLLGQPETTWKPDLVSALQKLTGDIEDIEISKTGGYAFVRFRHASVDRKPMWLDALQESDGTLRVAGLLSALLQEPCVPVIALEEPELTIHPGAIPLLYDFLKEASRRSQIIVTTHSPELLDLMDVDEIRVVLRSARGTEVRPMAENQRQAVRSGLLTLGDVFRTEGLQAEPE